MSTTRDLRRLHGRRGRLTEGCAGDSGPASPQLARRLYELHAPFYGWQKLVFMSYRRRAVELLALRVGDRVLDVGCGTGLCFPLIEDRIGPSGRLVGVDLSAEMLREAREQVRARGWSNVALVAGDAGEAEIGGEFDALLFAFTHDLLQSQAAVESIFGHAREGARVASVGPVWAPWWAPALNVLLAFELAAYVTTYEGLDRPWRQLERFVADLRVRRAEPPVFYYAWGCAAARGSSVTARGS